jgi:thioester reductase-like protein
MTKVTKIFITGVTGVLGRHILKLLFCQRNSELILLMRGSNLNICKERYRIVLKEISKVGKIQARVRIVLGDVTKPNLGILKKDYDQLCNSVDEIFHCAAFVDYYQSFQKGQLVNVVSTKNMLKFANRCSSLKRLNYISTAFIAGNYQGEFKEGDFDRNQSFNGSYEKSKFISEGLIRNAFNKKFDISIYRPSAIVGEYASGNVANYQMFYQFFRSLSLNLFTVMPLYHKGVFNLIPCDFAAKAIYLLSKNSSRNATYHIISPENFLITKLVKSSVKYFNSKEPLYVDIKNFNPGDISISEQKLIQLFLPFLNYRTIFNGNATFRELKKLGYDSHPLDEQFIIKLFDYAIYNRFMIRNKRHNV